MALADTGANGQIYALAAAIKVTLAGTVAKGDPIGYSSGWVRADADAAAGPIHADLVALEAGVSGDVILAAPAAQVSGRFGGACVPGTRVYASAAAGQYTETKPDAASGDATTEIGVSVGLDSIAVNIAGNRSTKA